ncbi:unnamed protein product [Moneuplotes crassus]|uniref:Uncharacterized protein n=1 Tax=Euplotes crassus TaxID=5936 RepID=A0AAD1UBW0_EUPCR|nr:unnamed protein product [Moneuplotes crassus]
MNKPLAHKVLAKSLDRESKQGKRSTGALFDPPKQTKRRIKSPNTCKKNKNMTSFTKFHAKLSAIGVSNAWIESVAERLTRNDRAKSRNNYSELKLCKTRKRIKTNFKMKNAKRKLAIQHIRDDDKGNRNTQEVNPIASVDGAALSKRNFNKCSLMQRSMKSIKNVDYTDGLMRKPTRTTRATKMSIRAPNSSASKSNSETIVNPDTVRYEKQKLQIETLKEQINITESPSPQLFTNDPNKLAIEESEDYLNYEWLKPTSLAPNNKNKKPYILPNLLEPIPYIQESPITFKFTDLTQEEELVHLPKVESCSSTSQENFYDINEESSEVVLFQESMAFE